jgi:diguanylate cyclase (GGDEF)-like protein
MHAWSSPPGCLSLMTNAAKTKRSSPVKGGRCPSAGSRQGSLLDEVHFLRDSLGAQSALFELVLEKMVQGLCFFDGSKRLILSNRRYAELYGIAPGAIRPGMGLREIIELRFAAGSVPEMTQAEYLAWRERVASGDTPIDSIIEMRNGRVIHIHHEPMPDKGWIATHEDITERRRSQDELYSRTLHFDAAIANMSQGLCMFSPDERMIVCNQNYLTIFGLSSEFVKPGISLYDVLQHSVDINIASARIEELYLIRREVIAAKLPTIYSEVLADGRIIDIWHRPMADGGWVSTYDDVTERREAESRIAYLATHDPLTDLPNRSFLRERLSQLLIAMAKEEGKGSPRFSALLLLDLDRFKEINDTLGHAAGDRLLRMVAERLRKLVGEEDLVARLGGDEFAILHSVESAGATANLAQRIIDVLIVPYNLDGNQANIGASIGISLAPTDGLDSEVLLSCADLALYRAKSKGRGGFAFFESEMTASAQHRRVLELELRDALIQGEFEAFYQPQFNTKTDQVTGAEALIRWRHPLRGIVGPNEFISIAEEVGLIVPIGEWILRQACREAARWREGMRVAVNISAAQFKGNHLTEMIVSALAAGGLSPAQLELEITESVLLDETEATLKTLHQLRRLGVRVSLDDFGTGYSSLSYLRSFPFDKIKIDRSFVRDVATSANGAAFVRAIAGLGASLGMEITAEGVETQEQLDLIRREGCTEAQGYYFSPPRPAAEIRELMGSRFGNWNAVARAANSIR